MLGIREPEIYGSLTLRDIETKLIQYAKTLKEVKLSFYQSNHEGSIVDKIQKAYNKFDGILINPAAYTHTSVAIADAIAAVNIPTVEVHLSDINSREEFRRHSYIAGKCIKQISGLGAKGYELGIFELYNYLNKK